MDDKIEAPAMAEARALVARCREPDDSGFAPLDPQAGHAFIRHMTKWFALSHPLNMTKVCVLARAGMTDADLALRELIAEFIDRGERLPPVLSAYNLELIHPHRVRNGRRGREKTDHVMQDIAIVTIVILVAERFGLKPTRRQSTKPSACSVVAQALAEAGIKRGGEKAVEKLWQRLSPAVL